MVKARIYFITYVVVLKKTEGSDMIHYYLNITLYLLYRCEWVSIMTIQHLYCECLTGSK